VKDNSEIVEREIEALVCLVNIIRKAKDWVVVTNALALYAQRQFPDKALTRVVFEALNEAVVPGFTPQSEGDPDQPLTGEQSDFINLLRQFHGGWKMMSNNDGYHKIMKLLSVLTAAGLISKTGEKASVKGLRLFADAIAQKENVTCFDVADCIIESAVFFFEGGYECIRTGTLTPLLFGDFDMRRFDELYCNCCRWMQYAQPGNLMLAGIDQNDLAKSLDEASDLGKKLMYTVKSPINKRLVQERKIHIDTMIAKLQQFRASGSLVEKAYCIAIYGKTSVGKSTIGNYLMTTTLHSNGFDATDEYTVVLNEEDRYMSNYKSFINGIFLDDVANTKSNFVDGAPTARVLRVVNNIKQYANMAEAELKGKVVVAPKVVVCTSNLKDMGATIYSNEPVSIVRRANVVITASVKPEFAENNQLRHHKVKEYYRARGQDVPPIIDAWNFKVEVAYPVPNTTKGKEDTLGWKIVCWNGVELSSCDIFTLIAFLNRDSREHFANEKKYVETNSNLVEKIPFCDTCNSLKQCCICDESGYVHRVSYKESTPKVPTSKNKDRSKNWKKKYVQHMARDPPDLPEPEPLAPHEIVERNAVLDQIDQGIDFISERGIALVNWLRLPTVWFRIACVYRLIAIARRTFGPRLWLFMASQATLGTLALGILLPTTIASGILCAFFFSVLYAIQWLFNLRFQLDHALARPVWRPVISREQKRWAAAAIGFSSLMYMIYMVCRFRKAQREHSYVAQGILHPTSEEIERIDASQNVVEQVKAEQNWANVEVTPIPTTNQARTTTAEDLARMCKENLCSMSFEDKRTNAFFLCSNVALIPRHVARTIDKKYCKFVRHDETKTSGNFGCWLSSSHMVDVPGMDFTVVYVPSGGSWRSLLPYLPLEIPDEECHSAIPMTFGYKDREGRYYSEVTTGAFDLQCNNGICDGDGKVTWPGWHHTVKSKTFQTAPGMCMGPLVAKVKHPFIAGFHLGGVTGTRFGVGGIVEFNRLSATIRELSLRPGVFLSNSDGELQRKQFDVNVLEGTHIHEKSSLHRLPIKDGFTPNLKIYGSCIGRAKYYSEVAETLISKTVERVCGVSNTWGKPAFHKGDAFAKSLEQSVHSSNGVPGDVLDRAVLDYVQAFRTLLRERPELKEDIRPLTQMENLCGVDGKKFIDKLPPNTSIGFPLSGPKKFFMRLLDPTLFEGFSCPVELDTRFWDQVRKAKQCYLSGERFHLAFKACLKDEATPLEKDKVRVFQAAPVVLQLLIREYFLPIVRLLSLFPALSECAVGINCMGPDWQEMAEHMSRFGTDRIVAGDYKKYDLTMPAQLTGAAFKILILIAQECGYTDEEIAIMNGIASDVVYPVMAYNGDLIQLMGSNPSGHNLTVYINSIVNSLLFRCAFYSLDGKQELKFRDFVSILTYGDDVKGSVKQGHDDFNNVYLCSFFKKHGIDFTPPDKVSEHKPFRHDHESDFLKRTSQFIPELGMRLGKLNEDSIWKSLHSNIVSKVLTPEQHSAACIDGAMREWALYGREKYEERRTQMQEVARTHDIDHITTMLSLSYDEWLDSWRERYVPHSDGYESNAPDEDPINSLVDYVRTALLMNDESIMERVLTAEDGWERLEHIALCVRITVQHASHYAEGAFPERRIVSEWNRFMGFRPGDAQYALTGRDLFHRIARFQNLWLDPWDDATTLYVAKGVYSTWLQGLYLSTALNSIRSHTAVAACELVPFDPAMSCNGHDGMQYSWEVHFLTFGWFVQQYFIQNFVKRQAYIAIWRVLELPRHMRWYHLLPFVVFSLTVYGNLSRVFFLLACRVLTEIGGAMLCGGFCETAIYVAKGHPVPDKWECNFWNECFRTVVITIDRLGKWYGYAN
jgi:hypothetical protein